MKNLQMGSEFFQFVYTPVKRESKVVRVNKQIIRIGQYSVETDYKKLKSATLPISSNFMML